MGFLNFAKTKSSKEATVVEPHISSTVDTEKDVNYSVPSEKDDEESLSSDVQAGVKAVEAAATVWTKYHLMGAYAMYVLCLFSLCLSR
jgi:hypothetical protein